MSFKSSFVIFLFASLVFFSCKKKDTSAPTITLKGDATVLVQLNGTYIDSGAEAFDEHDGTIAATTTDTVNTNFAGTYYIVYSAIDAAGHQTDATRTVIVRNDADQYAGNYSSKTVLGINTSSFQSTLATSTTLNNRIWYVGYATANNAVVYADIRHDTVSVPMQSVDTGSPSVTHVYSGMGSVKIISDTLIFEINYTDSIPAGTVSSGITTYKKPNL